MSTFNQFNINMYNYEKLAVRLDFAHNLYPRILYDVCAKDHINPLLCFEVKDRHTNIWHL